MWTYLDRRARRLGLLDIKLGQFSTICFVLILVKLIPQILTINIWVLVVLCILFAVRPLLTFFAGDVESGT